MSDQDARDALEAREEDEGADVEAHAPIDRPIDAPVDAIEEPPDVEGHAFGAPVDRPVDSPVD